MKMLPPETITDATLISSDVPETAPAAYNSGTTYGLAATASITVGTVVTVYESLQAANTNHAPASSPLWWRAIATTYTVYNGATSYAALARVIDPTAHRVYESVQGTNSGHALTDPLWWTDAGPTGRWAPFDQSTGTYASRTGSMTVELATSKISGLVVMETDAVSVNATMTVAGVEVYNKTRTTNVGGALITNWWRYFFEPIGKRSYVLFLDLPVYPTATLKITWTAKNATTTVKCGVCAVGRPINLGITEAGVETGIKDFSDKVVDKFGVTTFVRRSFSRIMKLRVLFPRGAAAALQDKLAQYRGIMCVWIGEETIGSTVIFGIYNSFKVNLEVEGDDIAYGSLEIEGGAES